jgi:two-component system chemotaxis response regulator CheB
LKVVVEDTAPVNRHKPSVDVLFDSLAILTRKKMVAAILTGMGADGAKGLLNLQKRGFMTFGQDEESCVVYGMPREAAKIGAVNKVLPLEQIANALISSCSKV